MTAKKDTHKILKASPVKSAAKANTAPAKAGNAKSAPKTDAKKTTAAAVVAAAAAAKDAVKASAKASRAEARTSQGGAKISHGGANAKNAAAAVKPAVRGADAAPAHSKGIAKNTAPAKSAAGATAAKLAAAPVKTTAAAKPAVSAKTTATAKPAAPAKPIAPAKPAAAPVKTTAPVKPAAAVPARGAGTQAHAAAAVSPVHQGGAPRKPFAGAGKKFKPPAMLAPHFSDKEIKEFRARLLELHRQLVNSVNSQLGDALPIADKINVDEDGTEAFDRVVGLEQAGKDQQKINKVKEALLALEAGTYGLCQICNGKIAAVRLKALPFAFTCVACQEKIDNPNGEKSRLIDLLD